MANPFLGQIMQQGFNFAARGWALCDGQLLPISQYSALFSLLGTTYGGDGRTTFGLPDLRGRISMHVGNGPGLSDVRWGQKGGTENVTLNITNLPAHTHTATLKGNEDPGDSREPENSTLAGAPSTATIYNGETPNVNMKSGSVVNGMTGNNQSFQIRNPYLGVYHTIALQGVYPSRS